MSIREDLRKVRKKASFCVTHWTQQNGSSTTSSQCEVKAKIDNMIADMWFNIVHRHWHISGLRIHIT
ncbi:RAS guanyl-releasing protein 4 isoform X2 [Tachysurus ichikawai]